MNKTLLYILLASLILLGFAACRHDDDFTDKVNRTVLVYMVANNNLSGYDDLDIAEMEQAVKAGALRNGGRLMVYHNARGGSNTLFEITRSGERVVHATYSDLQDGGSLNPAHMSEVINQARSIGDNNPMGLVLWSHGTGWMDDNPANGAHFSFGLDNRTRMNLPNLRKALEGSEFEWIYFDCCHMITAEVVYELRDCARYFVGSTIELPLYGMPYDHNIPLFFKQGEADLVGAARNTFEYYRNTTENGSRFCSMTVVDGAAIEPFARATREVMEQAQPLSANYQPIPYQRGRSCTIYDMPQYMRELHASSATMQRWEQAYADMILYSAAIPNNALGINVDEFTGLGCNIVWGFDFKALFGYDRCQWWADVASYNKQLTISNQ